MLSPTRLLAFGALMLVLPVFAAPAAAAPPQPYHPGDRPGHETLQRADHRDRGGDRRWSRQGWKGHGHRHGWHVQGRFLPPRVLERHLRRHAFQPVGHIELRHGYCLVRAIDRFGRRVLLALDPVSGAILGRHRGW
ncbi:MAG: hypothetical protein BroJett029_18660 [Alphaproteobacteria bacterium]|nr:MAG: hypothetical protein BroJett029_18660 [Alphaproteobacteria bacterium]